MQTPADARVPRLSEDLSFAVEIVDRADKTGAYLPAFERKIAESGASVLVTWEEVKVLHYGRAR